MTCYLKGHTAKDFIKDDHVLADILAEQELEAKEAKDRHDEVEDSYDALSLLRSEEVEK